MAWLRMLKRMTRRMLDIRMRVPRTLRQRKGVGYDQGNTKHNDDVPTDIIAQTTTYALRLGLTASQHCGIVAAIINANGGNVDQFPITKYSAGRDRRAATDSLCDVNKGLSKESDRRRLVPPVLLRLLLAPAGETATSGAA